MHIVQISPDDDAAVLACHQTAVAARAVDDQLNPPQSAASFSGWLRIGWDANPSQAWYVPGEAAGTEAAGPATAGAEAAAIGWYRLELPDLENRDRAFANIVVHPAARRHGIGRELLRHAAARAAASGRSVLSSTGLTGSAGEAFARRAGFSLGLVEERRLLDLRTVPGGRFTRLRETAAAKAAGYTLVRWTGRTPEEHLGQVAGVFNAMSDAPHAAGYEADVWDADRVRERADAALAATGMRAYSIAARHEATGTMTALTQVFIAPEFPGWGDQGITAVTRPHRGHRLGLLVKAAMLEWLAETEPALDRITTDNAASNAHMIAINEALGYRPAPPARQFYQLPVADAR